MAATSPSRRPGRTLLIFGILCVLLGGGAALGGTWQPRLGLDLQGGTRITLQAETVQGSGDVSEAKMGEAVSIIRQRVNGTGVTEAQVTTQGGNQIIVEIPGEQQAGLAQTIGDTAQLRFRLVEGGPTPAPPGPRPGQGQQPGQGANNRPSPGWAAPAKQDESPGGEQESPTQQNTPDQQPTPAQQQNLEGAELLDWQPPQQLQQRFGSYQCPLPGQRDQELVDNPNKGLITCDAGQNKYLLGPAIIEGTQLTDATAGVPDGGVQYAVQLSFNDRAGDVFADVTREINGTGQAFAIVLDGRVLSAPTVSSGPILTGQAQITGNFTADEARDLANSLKYGALPLSFTHLGTDEVGPQLAGDQLQAGIIAGIIGLILVVVYCMLYYRALGFVVISSLLVAGGLTYSAVLLLSDTMNFTLTLPGVAGLIVAIGITADSFIVFFERLRDEVRDGRRLTAAVESGWARARMTILAADAVSFMAALVLYVAAIGVVKGFAFALGLTTLVDLFVVFFFTKPLVAVLARTKFFGRGHKLSGLDPKHLGVTHMPGSAPAAATPGGAR